MCLLTNTNGCENLRILRKNAQITTNKITADKRINTNIQAADFKKTGQYRLLACLTSKAELVGKLINNRAQGEVTIVGHEGPCSHARPF